MGLVQHERNGEQARDDYETPRELFDRIDRVFQFDFDAAASDHNARCGVYITAEMDALKQDWSKYGRTAWCNPPYNLWSEFLHHAHGQALKNGVTTVMLIPPRVDSAAFHLHAEFCDEVIFLKGRVQFLLDGKRPTRIDKKTGKEVESGNGAASALFVLRPRFTMAKYGNPRMVLWDWKEE